MNRTATATAPRPYFKTCAAFGAAECTALGTGLSREVFADIRKPRFARHRLIPQHVARHPRAGVDGRLAVGRLEPASRYVADAMSPKASAIFVVSLCRKSFPVLAILAWIAATRRALFARWATTSLASYLANTLEFSTFP